MACGLEARVPLASPALLSFGLALPEQYAARGRLQVCAARTQLSPAWPGDDGRPKQGFSVPMAHWLRGPLVGWAESLIGRDALIRTGLFDPELITLRWRAHRSGEADWSYSLWAILMAQIWAFGSRKGGAAA